MYYGGTLNAVEFIEKTEKERDNFRNRIAGDRSQQEEFDLVFDLTRLTHDQIIALIRHSALLKGLLEANKSKIEVF